MTNLEFVTCESADGYSIHAPGSTDEAIASGDAPYLVSSPWPAEEEHVIPPSAFDEARRVLPAMTHHVAFFEGDIIGEAETEQEAIALASPLGEPFNVDFYDKEDGPGVQGYEPDGMGVWIIDPAVKIERK